MNKKHNENGILAVLVVYERALSLAKPWVQLQSQLSSEGGDKLHLCHVLLYDNSLRPCTESFNFPNCTYVHNPKNGGTAAAYSCALQLAQDLGLGWLLLLDHDTLLPAEFLDLASSALISANTRPAALLPWVFHGERSVSPAHVTWTGSFRPLIRKDGTLPAGYLTGIASGSLLDRASLSEIGPLPKMLWLDYVDHWIFSRFNALGKELIVFDAEVQHDLSIFEPNTVSRTRLYSILDGEAVFISSLPWIARFIYPLRLGFRLFRRTASHPTGALDMLAWILRKWKKKSV